MCATCVFEPLLQAPIECGCVLAYRLTDAATRRSEFPSRRTGLTALPALTGTPDGLGGLAAY